MTPPTLDTEQLHGLVPLAATLGIRLAEATSDAVRVELDWGRRSALPAAFCTGER